MRLRVFLLLVALGVVAASAAPIAIVNGSFETGASGTKSLIPGSTALTGWTVSGSNSGSNSPTVTWTNSWAAEQGSYSIELGYGAAISQTVSLVPHATYQLSFYISGLAISPGGTPKEKQLDVVIGTGTTPYQVNYNAPNNVSTTTWTLNQFTFTATTGNTTLIFSDRRTHGQQSLYGPMLDNISLTQTAGPPVPEPGLSLLFGTIVVALPLARRLRRKRVSPPSA